MLIIEQTITELYLGWIPRIRNGQNLKNDQKTYQILTEIEITMVSLTFQNKFNRDSINGTMAICGFCSDLIILSIGHTMASASLTLSVSNQGSVKDIMIIFRFENILTLRISTYAISPT